MAEMTDVTHLLQSIEQGDLQSSEKLLPLVYDELRSLAAQRMSQEKPGQTLSATALVHEAYLRLVAAEETQKWNGRGHFFAAAAEAMRRIVIENARQKRRVKRGGGRQRIDLDDIGLVAPSRNVDILEIDEALTRLAGIDPLRANLVKLRFFAGLTMSEAAEALGISLATAERHWTFARTWLYANLSEDGERTDEKV